MSFIVRQIARRADGGEIIRTRELAVAEIIVGRGTDCDVQLADLGVMLRHLRLTRLASGRVAVEAIGGVPVEIDGSFVTRADLDPAAMPAIALASHRLSLAPGEAAGSIAITAERVIAAVDAADADAETGIFSLRGVAWGKRGLSWALALLIIIGGLLLPWWLMVGETQAPAAMVAAARNGGAAPATAIPTGFAADSIWTSGPLSTAHAGLSNNCGACHQAAFVSVRDTACTACHTPATTPDHARPDRLAQGRVPAAGLIASVHQGLDLKDGRCASCHKEHEGPRGALMVAASFCTDCHKGLAARLPDTALADVPDWGGHPQFRPNIVTAASATRPQFARVSLAAAPREASGLIYPHDIHLSATNAVANMVRAQRLPANGGALGCNYCHMPDSDGVRFQPISMEKNCAACHDLAFARDGDVVRTLPHGKPQQVAGILRDFYLSQALSPRAGVQRIDFDGALSGTSGRRLPGAPAAAEAADLARVGPAGARARADAAINAVFAPKGVCADCHKVIDTGAPNVAERHAIAAVTLADHYLPKGRFPHKQHRVFGKAVGEAACTACHTGTRASHTSADLLLPPVATCRQCHGAPTVATNVAADCTTCHGYHGADSGHAVAPPPRRIALRKKEDVPPAAGA